MSFKIVVDRNLAFRHSTPHHTTRKRHMKTVASHMTPKTTSSEKSGCTAGIWQPQVSADIAFNLIWDGSACQLVGMEMTTSNKSVVNVCVSRLVFL